MEWKIPLFKSAWSESDVEAVARRIRSGMFWAVGPEITEFEKGIAQYCGSKHAVAFSSGTSATHATLIAYNLKQGDEVIVPSFTFISTANSVQFVGAKPIFADIEDETFSLDIESVKEKVTSKTKAIMPIHYAGMPARDIRALLEYAHDKNLLLIEDAAESLGATVNKTMTGTQGDCGMYSFCSNKVITTGEGGMIVTDSDELAHKLRLIASHGRLDKQNFFTSSLPPDYVQLGYNFRMPTMCAALGVSQLARIESYIKKRIQIANKYTARFSKLGIKTLIPSSTARCVFQMFPLLFKNSSDKAKVKEALTKAGIMSKTYFDPVHESYFYKKVLGYKDKLPVTSGVSSVILNIPIYPDLTDKEIELICSTVEGALS